MGGRLEVQVLWGSRWYEPLAGGNGVTTRYEEAERRGVRVEAVPTREACRLLADLDPKDAYAILHVTC